ncbi:Met-10+ like-protein-domain-containing protein [Chiua virens]|nr:Met-10+ like-protein-domain-containing protein [Chiua virens]
MFGIAQPFMTIIGTRHKLPISTISFSTFSSQWQMQCGLDTAPPVHRWMKDSLDRDAFHKSLQVLGVRVPASKTASVLRSEVLKKYIIDLPKIKSVIWDPSGVQDRRVVLLKVQEEAALAPEARFFLQEQCADLVQHKIDLDYNYWTADEIITSILPQELCDGSPTGFAITGHIAHMNLNQEYLRYKHLIGQIILDKNPGIKTVVNKLDNIDNKFRFFEMEVLAGEPDFVVEHHESDCRFVFDFSKVYWNSRLHTEHDRLVQLFKPEDVVADVFAGVGPFAIPAAKKGCAVLANDLNPKSAHWLSKNIVVNHVSDVVRSNCEDGRDFIRNVVARVLEHPFPAYAGPRLSRIQERQQRHHREKEAADGRRLHTEAPIPLPRNEITQFVMNLPDTALEFLDAFRGILTPQSESQGRLDGVYATMPMVHCYCFTRELEPHKAEADIRQRAEAKMGSKLGGDETFHKVRSVAPNKDMYCISFRLPRSVALAR